ncbi:TPA: sortase [Candidatus Dojkabacteria bacterium]|jgi:LPXTG-site transpeptidase (sortase) family protein|uniref:Sortase n=1 Tax=Candidatus Dojkabacteria bacterium TaxID=2099670 RepID=A0A832QE10_9BACT|nr:sortase [Candidatus Dojkabacteria bacterium]
MDNNRWNIDTESVKKVKNTRLAVSLILSFSGLAVIASQVIPLLHSYLDGVVAQKRVEIKAEPVPEAYKKYVENEFAYYDPGRSYFANLSEQLGVLGAATVYNAKTNKQVPIKVDEQYNKNMYITIESIGIKNIKISPNVESSNEEVYNKYLKSGVAHFKGTPVPGDGGNSFIYGHSAVEAFFSRHKDYPETIFSRLDGIDIGQEIVIKRDDSNLKYIVRSKKIVEATDFSVLKHSRNKETITLMTCWPLGIGTKRLIVTAERKI